MDYSLSTLISNVRRRGSIPNAQVTGTQDTDIIAVLNDVLQLKLPAKIIAVREGYMRQISDTTLTGTTVKYRLPTRAIGNRITAVLLLDSQGNTLRKLDEIPYGRLREFYAMNNTAGYTFEAGSIKLVPSYPISTAVTLRIAYYIRPNQLSSSIDAPSGDCFTITAINGNVLTIASSHGLTTSTKIDVIKRNPPFEHVLISTTPTATASNSVTVSDATGIEVGDYVCKEDKAPVAQVPDACYPLLAHLCAMSMLESLGDRENHKRLAEMLPALEQEVMSIISPRNEEGAKKIISAYGSLGMVDGPYRRAFWGV